MHASRGTTPTPKAGSAPTPGEFAILFTSTPRGARLARLLAVQQLDSWGIPYASTDSDTLALLVAELAANAVQHGRVAGRDFRLRVTLCAGRVRIAVTDARAEARPHPGIPDPFAASGRGLQLVAALSARWGVTAHEPGKTVWCDYLLGS